MLANTPASISVLCCSSRSHSSSGVALCCQSVSGIVREHSDKKEPPSGLFALPTSQQTLQLQQPKWLAQPAGQLRLRSAAPAQLLADCFTDQLWEQDKHNSINTRVRKWVPPDRICIKKSRMAYSLTVFLFICVTLFVFFIAVLTEPNFIFCLIVKNDQ